jgi:hypothetical protein
VSGDEDRMEWMVACVVCWVRMMAWHGSGCDRTAFAWARTGLSARCVFGFL